MENNCTEISTKTPQKKNKKVASWDTRSLKIGKIYVKISLMRSDGLWDPTSLRGSKIPSGQIEQSTVIQAHTVTEAASLLETQSWFYF